MRSSAAFAAASRWLASRGALLHRGVDRLIALLRRVGALCLDHRRGRRGGDRLVRGSLGLRLRLRFGLRLGLGLGRRLGGGLAAASAGFSAAAFCATGGFSGGAALAGAAGGGGLATGFASAAGLGFTASAGFGGSGGFASTGFGGGLGSAGLASTGFGGAGLGGCAATGGGGGGLGASTGFGGSTGLTGSAALGGGAGSGAAGGGAAAGAGTGGTVSAAGSATSGSTLAGAGFRAPPPGTRLVPPMTSGATRSTVYDWIRGGALRKRPGTAINRPMAAAWRSAEMRIVPMRPRSTPRGAGFRRRRVSSGLRRLRDHAEALDAGLAQRADDTHHVAVRHRRIGADDRRCGPARSRSDRLQLGLQGSAASSPYRSDRPRPWRVTVTTSCTSSPVSAPACTLRQVHVDALLQDRRGDHEDHQQHQHDVDQRRDVDLRQRLVVALAC